MTIASRLCASCWKLCFMALRSRTPLCASIRLNPCQSCWGLGQRNLAMTNRQGLGLSGERKTPSCKAPLCPFGSRLNPPLIKIDDKIVNRPLR